MQNHDHWLAAADSFLQWHSRPEQLITFPSTPQARWFAEGKLNITQACLDRHMSTRVWDAPAFITYTEDLQTCTTTTYSQLALLVNQYANVLLDQGVGLGDRVAIYMGSGVHLVAAMLGCARIGAIHSVIFAGFSAEAIKTRLVELQPKVMITADVLTRRGRQIDLWGQARMAKDLAAASLALLVKNEGTSGGSRELLAGEYSLDNLLAKAKSIAEPVSVDSNHPLFVLYTSGSTGKPKGIVHSTAGFAVHAMHTGQKYLGLKPGTKYWCTADIGWITGHSYLVYAPLALGSTQLVVQGAMDYPASDKWLKVLEREQVESFYTSPTAIRKIRQSHANPGSEYDTSHLRIIGSVGEPINPEVSEWYRNNFGHKSQTEFVDTWWQTETGGHILVNGRPVQGVELQIDQEQLFLKGDWPGRMIGCWQNDARYQAYFKDMSQARFWFTTGDAAEIGQTGEVTITGRIDDVANIAGHRIGSAEIENIALQHPDVAEAAAVAVPDSSTGEAIVLFLCLKISAKEGRPDLQSQVIQLVSQGMGKFAAPREIKVVEALPKTRSGKIMRRVLKAEYTHQAVGDLSTLER